MSFVTQKHEYHWYCTNSRVKKSKPHARSNTNQFSKQIILNHIFEWRKNAGKKLKKEIQIERENGNEKNHTAS